MSLDADGCPRIPGCPWIMDLYNGQGRSGDSSRFLPHLGFVYPWIWWPGACSGRSRWIFFRVDPLTSRVGPFSLKNSLNPKFLRMPGKLQPIPQRKLNVPVFPNFSMLDELIPAWGNREFLQVHPFGSTKILIFFLRAPTSPFLPRLFWDPDDDGRGGFFIPVFLQASQGLSLRDNSGVG